MTVPMFENVHNLHQQREQEHRPYWKRIHHSFIFWVVLLLMFVGIIYYIMSVDFAFAPHRQLKHPSENSITR